MKTKKIVAMQVSPEYQESPLDCDEMFPDNAAVLGNDRMNECIPERCTKALEVLRDDSFWGDIEDPERAEYADAADVLGDWLPRENGAAYNADECRAFAERLLRGELDEDADALAALMALVEGKPWESRTICGSCQSDWNYMIYPVDEWTENAREYFESEYWNTGDEWLCYEIDADALESVDLESVDQYDLDDLRERGDVSVCVYTHEWDNEKIKIEIAGAFGAAPEDVVLLEFDGYVRTPRYTVA